MSGVRCLWRRWCSGHRRVRPPAWCALLGRAAWCARGRRPAREPSALRASLGASSRSPARPRRRPWVPQPGPPVPWPCCFVACGTADVPVPSGPAPAWCALLGRAAWCARGRRPAREPSALRASLGASSRSPARPRHRPRAPQPCLPDPPAPSAPAALVSLCVVELPLEARPSPAAAHGLRSLALRRPGLAVLLLVAPLVFWRRRARPPARSPHTSLRLGVVDLEARPGPPDPSAPSTLASLVSLCVVELPLEARPSPAAAHGCRS